MAYRTPDAECYIIKSSGIDRSHCHSYRFRTREEQSKFWINKNVGHFADLSEIRIYDGAIRVKKNADDRYYADYVMFRNYADDKNMVTKGRWFYAFIDSIQYLNDAAMQINYTIDWIQTYFTEVAGNPPYSYCVRQHSTKDTLYHNLQKEPVSSGDVYMNTAVSGWSNMGVEAAVDDDGTFVNWAPVVVAPKSDVTVNDLVDGIPNAVEYYWGFSKKWFNDLLNQFDESAKESIIDIFMYPVYLLNKTSGVGEKRFIQKIPLPNKTNNPWKKYGFTPKNNKLYTYPFCYLTVTGANQGGHEYRNEYFEDGTNEAEFRIYGTLGNTPQFICVPVNYGGVTNADKNHLGENFHEAVVMQGAPKVPWITDQYKVWLAQHETTYALNQIALERDRALNPLMSMYNIGKSLLGGNAFGAFESGVQGAMNDMSYDSRQAEMMDAENMALKSSNYGANSIYYKCGEYGFRAMVTHCPKEFATMADDYFTCFGYAVNNIIKPNFFARENFCYMKYTGFDTAVKFAMPEPARLEWQKVMANGITFWNPGTTIGDYSVENGVT